MCHVRRSCYLRRPGLRNLSRRSRACRLLTGRDSPATVTVGLPPEVENPDMWLIGTR